jgi:hypothetical protein
MRHSSFKYFNALCNLEQPHQVNPSLETQDAIAYSRLRASVSTINRYGDAATESFRKLTDDQARESGQNLHPSSQVGSHSSPFEEQG